MPIIRRLLCIGKSSKAIVLPKGWLDYAEREAGHTIDAVAVEINREIRILPLSTQRKEKQISKVNET